MTNPDATSPAAATRAVTSFCRLCQAFCGVRVHVSGDRIVRVTGDPDNPLSKGYTCAKGRAGGELHHHPRRLEHPLLRGADGVLAQVSWSAALDDLSTHLRSLVDAHGPDAVGFYMASGWGSDATGRPAVDTFIRALGSTQVFTAITIDSPSKMLLPVMMLGPYAPFPAPDLDRTQLLLYIGQNVLVSHGHLTVVPNVATTLRAVQKRGGHVVVVDPRRTETARLADVHVALRAGTDAALLAFLVREALLRRPDTAYLQRAVTPDSLERLRVAVAGYDLDRTAAICGVPAQLVARVRDLVLTTPRLAVHGGTGATMQRTANVCEWLGLALAIVTGSLDRAGGMLFNPGVAVAREKVIGTGPTPYGELPARARPGYRRLRGELPAAILADEILAGGIRALVVVGGNPALVLPDSAKARRALRSLDVLAVVDIIGTETGELATHLLPGAGQYERADLNLGSYLHVPYVQYAPAVLPPAAERKPTWWIFQELAVRLGLSPYGADGTTRPNSDDEVLAAGLANSRIPLADLRAAEHGTVAADAPGPGWLIPDGLAAPIDLAPQPVVDQLAAWSPPPAGELVLTPRRLPGQMNSAMRDIEQRGRRAASATLLISPADAQDRGIGDNEDVTVRSAVGACQARAELSDAMPRGCVSLPHGWDGPNVNMLTSDATLDEITGMPLYAGLPVEVFASTGAGTSRPLAEQEV